MNNLKWEKFSLVGAVIAAITASLCCVAPLALLALGLGAAWMSTLTHLEFLRPIGIAITIIFLVLAFWKLYITPNRCTIDKFCIKPKELYVQRIIFWIVTLLLILLLAFPWYAFLFY